MIHFINHWSLTCRGDLSARCGLEHTPLASEALGQCCHVQYEVLSKSLDSYAVIKFNNQLKIFYYISTSFVTVRINIYFWFCKLSSTMYTGTAKDNTGNLLSFHNINWFPHIKLLYFLINLCMSWFLQIIIKTLAIQQ